MLEHVHKRRVFAATFCPQSSPGLVVERIRQMCAYRRCAVVEDEAENHHRCVESNNNSPIAKWPNSFTLEVASS